MRFEKLDLNLLVVLANLLDTESVSETAERLYVSQPTVSAALKRLRSFFSDELLIPVGRTMVPTPKGLELKPAIQEMLNIAKYKVIYPGAFDEKTSSRQFKIIASDYTYDFLVSRVISKLADIAPNLEFDILPISPDSIEDFLKGRVDLFITVNKYLLSEHPSQFLISDEDVIIACSNGRYSKVFTEKDLKNAQVAAVRFGAERRRTTTEDYLKSLGYATNVVVQVPSFASLPVSIINTNRIAILHRRHAEHYAKLYSLCIHELPVNCSSTKQLVQWHKQRSSDLGVSWLVKKLEEESYMLSNAKD